MARRQYDDHEHVIEAQKLIRLLDEFDDLATAFQNGRGGGRP